MDAALAALLDEVAGDLGRGRGKLVILTGAGLSADSGLPTFRGPGGYWTVGSQVHHPEEIATRAAWNAIPDEVWRFTARLLRAVAGGAPNAGHRAIAELDRRFGERCVTVTQNVDGYHLRAGNHPDRVYAIHGDGGFVRCGADCCFDLLPRPASVLADDFDPSADPHLRCPRCRDLLRPHALFFDEYYSEPLYRSESALEAAREAALLLVVGTAGATTLPNLIAREAVEAGAAVIDVNPADDPFAELARALRRGHWVRDTAAAALPAIAARLIARDAPAVIHPST
ncbi:SIR2 family NAD-dependent protein deacylase [Nannocystis punicea]|uniref:protein acetyllysine N-acetyltransferase n=1 Tax=Nannocystis punicea TaxID=2995304 RepID=A0ABY7H5L4_9BACT|nr:Sir2 family NAD-dependent protein deacetylase [Nannocystis poenicansa]WAS94309.1 RNA polymerase subunit sigma [Nannocystis poenicansa]